MALTRSKSLKAKKYGTPTTPSVSTPKAPSPKAPKIVRTETAATVTTAPKAVTKPTTQRGIIPQTPAGIQAQQKFQSQILSITQTIKNQIQGLKSYAETFHTGHPYLDVIKKDIEKLETDLIIIDEPVIEEPIIEEPIIELPELLPEVIAEPQINDSINDNMVTQQVINFNIINGRAVGSIKFTATNNFNEYYYGHNIVNIIQFKDPNGVNILTTVKQNTLNFTKTERTELIHYDEDMRGNTRATVESFVWSDVTTPTPFSKMYSINISETEEPKPVSTGIMGAGVAGAIGILILAGFIADSRRKK